MRHLLTVVAAVMALGGGVTAQDPPIYEIGNGITSPVLIREVKPKYTEDAMRRRVEGTVELSAVVKADGKVGDVTVTRSLDEGLDQEAIAATRQWEFKPGTKDGEPVNVRVSIELSFSLKKK